MKAVRYDTFEGPIRLVDVPDPTPSSDGVVVKVGASGLCRSDWHAQVGSELARMGSFPGVGVTIAVLD